mgnify:CR=1 FL=1
MKRIMIITAMLAAISLSLQAEPKVEMKTSGPSGQGDVIWWAPATGVTNLAMGTGGLYNVTLDSAYPITGTGLLPGNLTLANTYMIVGNASGIGAAATPAAIRTNLSLVVGTDVQAYDADLDTWATVTPSANGKTLVALANYAAMRTNLSLVVGTDVQAYDADLDAVSDRNLVNMTNLAAAAIVGVVDEANGGAGSVSGILKADGAGLVSAASAGTDYLAPNTVWGYPGLATVTNLLENAVTITAKDTAGATLAGYRLFHVWVSDSDKGAATTNNIETLVLSTGTAISTVTANADYWYCSAAAGTAVATVTATAAGTNYLMVADGSSISSIALVETE